MLVIKYARIKSAGELLCLCINIHKYDILHTAGTKDGLLRVYRHCLIDHIYVYYTCIICKRFQVNCLELMGVQAGYVKQNRGTLLTFPTTDMYNG